MQKRYVRAPVVVVGAAWGRSSFDSVFQYSSDGINLLTQDRKTAFSQIAFLCNACFPCVLLFVCVGINDCPFLSFVGFQVRN